MRYFIITWMVAISICVAVTTAIWGTNFSNVLFGLTAGFFIGLVCGIGLTEAKLGLKQIRAAARCAAATSK